MKKNVDNYYDKYLKYKSKYLSLKKQHGGEVLNELSPDIIKQLFEIYYLSFTVVQDINNVENTHRGMTSYIKKHL